MDNKIKVKCENCGKEELVFLSRGKTYKTCSKKCMGEIKSNQYSTKIKKQCPICNIEFEVKKSHNKRRVCCSLICSKEYRSKYKTGENNSNYKTTTIIENGIKRKDYSRYKEPYHKIVKDWFNLNSSIKGYDIHHRDCNPNNNDITNLVLIPRSTHMLIHRYLGNILLSAYTKGLIDKRQLFSFCTEEQINFLKEIIDLNITNQKIIYYHEADNKNTTYKNIFIKK
jgi:hypothetical protein